MLSILRLLPSSFIWRETETKRGKERQRERKRKGTTEKKGGKEKGKNRGRGLKLTRGGARDLALGPDVHEPRDLEGASISKAASTILDMF